MAGVGTVAPKCGSHPGVLDDVEEPQTAVQPRLLGSVLQKRALARV